MPLDIDDFRKYKGGNPEKIRESEKKRYHDVKIVDEIIALDEKWRKLRGENDQLNKQKNSLGKEVGKLMKAGKKEEGKKLAAINKVKSKEIDAKIKEQEKIATEAAAKRDSLLHKIGNYIHESVPIGDDEDKHNKIVRTWGLENKRGFGTNDVKSNPGGGKDGALAHHHELLSRIDGYEPERGVRVAGHRAYFLKGAGVALNFALQTYAQSFLAAKGYTLLQTPYFMDKKQMGLVAELEDYDETLYHVGGGGQDSKYLIATSEQPICLYHAGEWMDEKELEEKPLFYCGTSTCFRKEAGKTGVDNWGIFRVHQFEKIEQFCVCAPSKSWEIHNQMIAQSEEFTKSLGLPYHVINICSGDLNNAAAKKYDLEAWFPGYVAIDSEEDPERNKTPKPHPGMRELVSCSNCLDYQSRAVEIRMGKPTRDAKGFKTKKKYVHMLNATLCATTRVICCILENFQTTEGILVPEVLLPFLNRHFVKKDSKGRFHIPYVQEAKLVKKPVEKKKKKKKEGKKGSKSKKGGGKSGTEEKKK
eukprot:CAMPEP_0167754674 /NCGR_PEP_ID=MMETSP0110_2-20121227/8401_1 /TAXON_ID=629695 /ORGANISM="Gymnochlora sp., Strain CCMP2014" /LENGTH=530 /DNA_ID=CAMNT_0007640579 /DNA_START=80 /DNA_END=1675 /DNA_ORIENTATION=-